MHDRYRIRALALVVLATVVLATVGMATPAGAQRPDPKIDVPESEDPAVQAILETKPTTPSELARAAKILADLDRPELGKKMLARVLAAGMSEQEWAALAEEFGTPMFSAMVARKEMLPEAKQVADAVLAAANRRLQDPRGVVGLIKQLQDPSPEARYEALAGLMEARGAAVAGLLSVLADASRDAERPGVRWALTGMGTEAVGPLLGILENADPATATEAVRALTAMKAKAASIHLLRPYLAPTSDPALRDAAGDALAKLVGQTPSRSMAVRLLTDRARAYFDRAQAVRADADGQAELWRWDAAKKQCVARRVSAEDAALAVAARLARDAYRLAPQDPAIRRLYLTTMLEAAAFEHGLDAPPTEGDETAGFDAAALEDAMRDAIAGDHVAAAAEAARLLGRHGTAAELLHRGTEPAPLVRAARHPDRRLRLAAAEAIVRLRPAEPFAGSSQVLPSLGYFAATGGVRRALVASGVRQRARELVGMLSAKGFEVDTAITGRELIRQAAASPDYELALIDVSISSPTADILLQQLRHDYRTATLRVGLTAAHGFFARAERIAALDPMAMAFHRPLDDQAIGWQVDRLATLAERTFVDHAQRQRQAAVALDLLAEIGRSQSKLYDVGSVQAAVLAALYVPELSTKAIAVLEHVNGAESQRALVELASRWTQPIETRVAASKAFQRSTQQFGILLTSSEISRQYDLYNSSENLDQQTQRLLGLILDCLEAPTKAVEVADEEDEKQP